MSRLAWLALVLFVFDVPARDTPAVREDFALGLAALAQRDWGAAENRFRAVLDADPSSYEAHNNLALGYAEQGRDEDAAEELRTALRLRPNYFRARQNLAATYLRLAAKELLGATENADVPRAEELTVAARALLSTASRLAAEASLGTVCGFCPSTPTATMVAAGNTPTQTALSASPPGTPPTPTPRAASLPVFIEPLGAQLLLIDTMSQVAALYRRDPDGLSNLGRWPVTLRGRVSDAPLLLVARRSDWSVRLEAPATHRPGGWIIESTRKVTKEPDAVVLTTADFRAATSALIGGRDAIIAMPGAPVPSLALEVASRVRNRLSARRQAEGTAQSPLREVNVLAAGDLALTRFESERQATRGKRGKQDQLLWRQIDGEWVSVSDGF